MASRIESAERRGWPMSKELNLSSVVGGDKDRERGRGTCDQVLSRSGVKGINRRTCMALLSGGAMSSKGMW